MASYYKQKLIKIDEEILNLEYLYQRELQREVELNKRTLLLSHGFKYRLDNLYKARAALVKATGVRNSKASNYAATLAERKNALQDAEDELKFLTSKHMQAAHHALVTKSIESAQESVDLGREIITQRTRVRNKQRALDNWINKAGMVQTNEKKLPANLSGEDITTEINVLIEQDVVDVDIIRETYKQHLESIKVPIPENNATIDLLSRPTTIVTNNETNEHDIKENGDETT